MAVYWCLILFVLLSSLLTKASIRDSHRLEKIILFWSLLALFLLLALKKETVGCDIAGYREQYLLAADIAWSDFDYVYYEKGYILLMKLFSKSGAPFGLFTGFLYGLLCLAYYRFLARFSEDAALSMLILICYQFLVFHISGLRQTLAMAVCIFAFLALDDGKVLHSLLLTALAVSFHKSALIFFAVYPIAVLKGRRFGLPILLAVPTAALVLRPVFWALVNRYLRELPAAGISLGGNFLFLAGMALFLLYTHAATPFSRREGFLAHMALAAMAANLAFSGSVLLRSTMYLTLFLIPGIPNAVRRYDPGTRLILRLALGIFLMLLFYFQTLAINQFDLLPYRFFWQ